MTKQIRPLIVFKKQYPEIYEFCWGNKFFPAGPHQSKKTLENMGYYYYCRMRKWKPKKKNFKVNGKEYEGIDFDNIDPFFFKSRIEINNIGTISELGRLLLTGWYYGEDVYNFTEDIYRYVYNSYYKKKEKCILFNDLEFKDAVKHIRENIGYYFYHKDELKLYILQKFFKEDLKPLLPPKPDELKDYDRVIEFLNKIHNARIKKDKNWYRNNFDFYEEYVIYLTELLDNYNISYYSEEEYRKIIDEENEKYHKKIIALKNDYDNKIINNSKALLGKQEILK